MKRILIIKVLEAYDYNKCFVLYSVLYDAWKIILELLGRGGAHFQKYF